MADQQTAPKGKDNNKRLALLEAGVSSLAIALGELGVTVAEGADPIELVIGLAKGQADKIDELEKAAAAGPDNATEGEIAAIARAETAETALDAANKEIAQLNIDLEQLEGQIEALGAAGDNDETAEPEPRPDGARDFGPTFGTLDRENIAELIAASAGLEISFSNGEYELVELAPVPISAADLVAVEGRYIAPVIFVRGGERREELHGAALVYQGEQIGYCTFPMPLLLEPKQERRFEKAITFG